MLALLIYSYAHGIFSSLRIERATWRDIDARFIATNTHPDHDTIASFRRVDKAAFEAAFLEAPIENRSIGHSGRHWKGGPHRRDTAEQGAHVPHVGAPGRR
jgi:transposase